MALPTQGAASAGGTHVYDPADETVMTESSLGVWDYRVGTGTKVITRDDHPIGTVHTVEIDADGKPRGIVVASGLIHHSHRTIPIAQIHAAGAKQIVLTITKDAYEAMAV